MEDHVYDVIIIGGGPAGLSAAQYTARANLKTLVLDKSPDAGALAYTHKIENYPGLTEAVSGKELLFRFRSQAERFGAEYVQAQVINISFDEGIKEVHTMDSQFRGKSIIIATGAMGRKASIPGEEDFLGKGVSYCATCDAPFYKGLTVCVAGDSDEALKEADVLADVAGTVYVISPSAKFEKVPDQHFTNRERIQFMPHSRIMNISGDDLVRSITVKNMKSGEEQQIDMDGVFIYLHGSLPVTDFISGSDVISEGSCVVTHGTMETSIPGVYAAGDVTCSEVRQVIIAAAYGVMAALSAEKFIRHRKRIRYDWMKS